MTNPTPEELANMSPEEIAEMQKQQCIFCKIVEGQVSSRKVYEDESCLAILDIYPSNPGHVLIIPKEHHTIMQLMPEKEVLHLFSIAKSMSKAVIRGLNADGTNIFVANGAAAGQKAPHFMIHVIPRKSNDGITAFSVIKNQITEEDQEKLRIAIRNKVVESVGLVGDELVEPSEEPVKPGPTLPKKEEVKQAPEEKEGAEKEREEPASKKFSLDKISSLFK
jgi:histidine triad (HIT) family protein